MIRQSQQQHRASVVSALEYVLAQRNDHGLESVQRGTSTNAGDGFFPSLEGGVQFLAQNGVFLQLPVN